MSSSFQMWSATPAAIAARGDLGYQDVGSVKLTKYRGPRWVIGQCSVSGQFGQRARVRWGRGVPSRSSSAPTTLRTSSHR
jgi:hypothetical protein